MPRVIAVAASALLSTSTLVACSDSKTPRPAEAVQTQLFAASSTRVINDELTRLTGELDPPQEVSFNNDGSGTLVTQLNEGAEADVLITANTSSMDQARSDGTATDPRALATNSMVMVVPANNPAGIESIADLTDKVNLVLCDPTVPCGETSAELEHLNSLDLSPVSLEGAVGDVLGKVTGGEADAGWVYRTDAIAAGSDVKVIGIPHAEDVPNTLWVSRTLNSPNPQAADALVELILSDDVAAILKEAGFTPSS